MTRTEISNNDDMIDSRDIERLREWGNGTTGDDALDQFADEGHAALADWEYGVTLVRDSYWVTYVQDLAYDCGLVTGDERWPLSCVDWERAARELQYDYCPLQYGNVTYWAR